MRPYSLVHDPIFYITVGFFALLTTGLPAALGQPNFLPSIQTLALFIFLLIPLRKGLMREALLVLAVWLTLQFVLMVVLTWLMQANIERAFHGGFQYRTDTITWLYGVAGAERPDNFTTQPVARVIELLGILVGSVISGGLIGLWFLVKSVNLAAYGMGIWLLAIGRGIGLLLALPLWTLFRLGGYAGFVALLGEPLLTGNWQLPYYWHTRRGLALRAGALLLIGLLLELFLPNLWRMALSG